MERQERWAPYLSGVPALKVSLLFLIGIGLANLHFATSTPRMMLIAGCGLILFWIATEWLSQRNPGWFTGLPASAAYFLLILYAGWFVVQMQQYQHTKNAELIAPLKLLAWEEPVVIGVIEERSRPVENRERIRLRVRTTLLTDDHSPGDDAFDASSGAGQPAKQPAGHNVIPIEWHQPYTLLLYRDLSAENGGYGPQSRSVEDASEEILAVENLSEEDLAVESLAEENLAVGDPSARGLAVGDSLRVRVRLYPSPEKRNPHDFDTSQWLKSQGIDAQGRLLEILTSSGYRGRTSGWTGLKTRFWPSIRQSVLERIDRLFPDPEEGAMAKALFLGQKEALSGDTKTAFSRSGLSHVMAVSGLHVGFVVAPFWLLIPWIRSSTRKKAAGFLLLCLLLLFYAGLTGFSASVMRASLMAVLLTFGKLFSRQGHSINLVCVVLLMLLVIDPGMLFQVGFQLSFTAVFIILLLMPAAQRQIPNRLRYSRAGPLISVMLVSAVVQVGLFPVLTAYFGEFSVIGPIANLLVVPLLSGLVPAGLLISVVPGLPEWLTAIPVMVMRPLLRWIPYAAETFGSTPVSFLRFSHDSVWLHLVWATGVLLLASWRRYRIRWTLLILLQAGVAILLFRSIMEGSGVRELEITFLDVGQGDAIHIRTPGGQHLLIDTGPAMRGRDAGEDILIPYLEYAGVDTIEAILLSHPHADHIGGTEAILRTVPVKRVFETPFPAESSVYRRYREMAERRGVPVVPLSTGEIVEVDPAIQIFVLSPYGAGLSGGNINNRSMVLRIDYGETTFLFTGDAEKALEQELVQAYGDFLNADVLKAGHHGSNTSSSASFVSMISPDWTVVSCAFENRFRHPGREAVTRIHDSGSEMLFTSLSGAIQIRSDGTQLKYRTVVGSNPIKPNNLSMDT